MPDHEIVDAKAKFDQFLEVADSEDVTDREEIEAMAGVMEAAGAAVFGIWDALNRIADALEGRK
jgi:hypothetical protein